MGENKHLKKYYNVSFIWWGSGGFLQLFNFCLFTEVPILAFFRSRCEKGKDIIVEWCFTRIGDVRNCHCGKLDLYLRRELVFKRLSRSLEPEITLV